MLAQRGGGTSATVAPQAVHVQAAAAAAAAAAEVKFDITLEATHHGPYCSVPACFVEIGSDARCVPVYIYICVCVCVCLNI